MKKLLFTTSTVITFNVLLLSCGQVQTKKIEIEQVKSPASVKNFTMDDVKTKLEKLVEAAKKSGEGSINYLASDFYLKASAAQSTGDYATANLLYEYLLRLTDDEFVKTKYSVSLIRSGDLEASQKYLSEIYESSKYKNSKIGLVLAGVYTGLNKVEEARKIYGKVLKQDPKNEDACVFLSKSYGLEDKFSKAKSVLEDCEKRDKRNGVYSYYIGKLYIDKGDVKSAQRYFKRSLEKQKDFSRSVLALGLIHEEKEQFEKATKVYKEFLAKEKNDKLILSRLVQVLFQTSKYKEIIPYAERLSDLDPEDLNLKVKLGVLYTDSKDYQKALGVFRDLLKAAPESDKILYYVGAIYQELDQYENSIEHFQKVPEKSALFQDSAVQVASMLNKMSSSNAYAVEEQDKFAERFIKYTTEKVEKFPTLKVEFTVLRASHFDTKGEQEKAITELETIITEKKFNRDQRLFLANLYEKTKDYDKAYDLVQKMIDEDPTFAYGWNFIGYSYLERGVELDKAYEYLQKALAISPKDGYILDSIAWYHYKKGDYDKALEVITKAIKVVSNDITISKHYATILRKVKKFDEAKKHLIQALSYAKEEKERTEIYNELKDLEQIRIPANKIEVIKK